VSWPTTSALLLAVVASAVSTVYVKHVSRSLFVELHALEGLDDEMEIEWGKLQLEQSTWAQPDRVRTLAVDRLQLYMPPGESVVLVELE
jgi:cell division protein FtsL